MIHVAKMLSVKLEAIGQFVDVLMAGLVIHTLNVIHVGVSL